MTPTTATAEAILDAWTAALTTAGWTLQTPDYIPGHLPTLRHLLDPAGRIQARTRAYSDIDIDIELRSWPLREDGLLDWFAVAEWISAETVIAAGAAVDHTATGPAAGDLLTAAGWHLQHYQAHPEAAEYAWTSADQTRGAHFETEIAGADQGYDGGWCLTRLDPTRHVWRITASPRTPAAIIAALALSAD